MMNSENKQTKKIRLTHPLLLITTSEQSTRQGLIAELALFLLRYSFFLNDTSEPQNSCAVKSSQFPTPQGNIYMGARYLDPKYSRWISVDPALGEYIPRAPINNEAKKHNQNLPGMGGVFNSVNLNLFHYAGNNPLRYVDPDGNDIWLATEWIGMLGGDVRMASNGETYMVGKARVKFFNLTTHESFSQTYDILCTDSYGVNFYFGASGGFTKYVKFFPENATKDDVKKSYTGIFASFSNPAYAPLSDTDVAGLSVSNAMVVGVDPKKGIDVDNCWIGINYSLSFNLYDLFIPGGLGVPNAGIQYQVYKLPKQDWTEYQEEFEATKLYKESPLHIPRKLLSDKHSELKATE